MAGIVKEHGVEYMPLLKRIKREIDALKAQESDLDWVDEILAAAA